MDEGQRWNGIGDGALQAKTGKTWAEWFAILDAASAQRMTHPEITIYLSQEQGVPDWWCQMVTVGYEQARGRRQVHQKTDGYAASASKTIAVPVSALYEAWADETTRLRWLPGATLTVRKASPGRSMRITWDDGTRVDADFYAKGDGKSQVSIQHSKLPDDQAVARMKAYWSESLDRLRSLLER